MTNNDILKDKIDICRRYTTYYNFDVKFHEKSWFFPHCGIFVKHVKGHIIWHKMSLKKMIKYDENWYVEQSKISFGINQGLKSFNDKILLSDV